MTLIHPYASKFRDSLLRLLQGFDSAAMTNSTWERLFSHRWDPEGRTGLLLVEKEDVVGFLGTIYSQREIAGSKQSFLNLTSWIVREEYRSQSLSLLFSALADRSLTVTDLTASPEAATILKRLGFKLLEDRLGLFVSDKGGTTDTTWWFGQESIGYLTRADLKKIASDHISSLAVVCVGRSHGRECLVVCSITEIDHPNFDFSPDERRLLDAAKTRGARLRVAHLHFISDPNFLEVNLEPLKVQLQRAFGVDALITDGRFIPEGASRWKVGKLPSERLFRSSTLAPSQVDNLYSECVLLGVSGQGYIVDPQRSTLEAVQQECDQYRNQIRQNDAVIDGLDQEIRSLERAEQERSQKQKISSALQSDTPALQGLTALSGRLRSYERSGYCRYPGAILMFHSVKPNKEKAAIPMNRDLEVTPEYLRNVVRMCQESGREVISLDEARLRIKGGLHRAKPFVVLTFDDGYKDNMQHAYPVLKELKVPFTIYVCTDFPNTKALLWWYMLEGKVRGATKIELKIQGVDKRYLAATTSEKIQAFNEIRYHLVTASSEDREILLQQLFSAERENWFKLTRDFSLTWDDIRTLSDDPLCTIGAHTVTHPSMKQLSEEQLDREINESRQILEEQIGKKVLHFCYPFGSPVNCEEREFRAVERAGFLTATTTTMSPLNESSATDLFALPRIPVRGTHESVDLMRLLIEGSEIGEMLAIDEYVRDLQRRLFLVEQMGISNHSPDMHILL